MKKAETKVVEKAEVLGENYTTMSKGEFLKYYNGNVPGSFPQATSANMKAFQVSHPAIFEDSTKWIIDKHRKKLMDWLVSNSGDS